MVSAGCARNRSRLRDGSLLSFRRNAEVAEAQRRAEKTESPCRKEDAEAPEALRETKESIVSSAGTSEIEHLVPCFGRLLLFARLLWLSAES